MTTSTKRRQRQRQSRVSFHHILDIHEYTPLTDSETKSKLYYTDHEIKMMKIEAKSSALERRIQKQQLKLATLMKQNCELLSLQFNFSDAPIPSGLNALKRPVTPDSEIGTNSNSGTNFSTKKTLIERPVTPDHELDLVRSSKRMRFLPVAE
mmetsp:Transcript_30777/g.46679  ORF Transcript_30777/g.46679 Transcript_30777/m.46679 type:complete len:152 (-) Transcript_30777:220-675(-)|eukprot:CAMPEP_0178919718 /NCGR_PEP_ID=MMETSP0786-20121207/14599_1 /TAXON_ID=186022 /ORGANISM="Thalassionema frauenfeldii, Strain CCMP 1798" /LENGTH=151 /DNA_ID=CAMNT_0020593693 /DNA_START=432 /DNA_END=887 /DNA_ORIENTATION=-